MVIIILAAGTRGESQPYIALGLGLKKVGHHIHVATFKNDEAFIKSFGMEFYGIKGDILYKIFFKKRPL